MTKLIYLDFDLEKFHIELYDNPISDYVHHCFYHLQHFNLNFNIYDNPYAKERFSELELHKTFLKTSKDLNLQLDATRLTDQNYLNFLHELYEKSYSNLKSSPQDHTRNLWLMFHECIHLLEYTKRPNRSKILRIDFRNLNAKLNKPFKREFYKYGQTQVRVGQCYLEWSELGKKPYVYFENNEPKDLNRLCKSAKPWVELKPIVLIALEDKNFIKNFQHANDFNFWFADLKGPWCEHWNITDWTNDEMFTVIPIGELNDIASFKSLLEIQQLPKKIRVEK